MNPGGGVPQRPPQRVCFFGTYARGHAVTRLLFQACQAAGIEVVECHRPLWELAPYKRASYFSVLSLAALLARYAQIALALARARRRLGEVTLYVIGFNGQLDYFLLRLLLRRHKVPIVLAPLVTLSETLVDDRGVFQPGSVRSWAARLLDRASLSRATRVIMDAEAHRQYVIETFAVTPSQVATWYLGADAEVFRPRPPSPRRGPVRVLFYGSFLPLHGVQTILQAASLLAANRSVEFVLVGDGPEHQACVDYARGAGLDRVRFIDWVPYETLGELVAEADICLGVFGASRKAQMVIPTKVYQAAAVGRPIVTADTPAIREVFTHGQTAWLCPAGEAGALADAIVTLSDDKETRARLGCGATRLMAERFSPSAQGERLAAILAAAAGGA